jgi:uncharacterized delta-60 repeat protein
LLLLLNELTKGQAIDNTFNPNIKKIGFSGEIKDIVSLPDGRIIVGGDFYSITGVPCNSIARLNADGSVDRNFHSVLNEYYKILDLQIQTDNKILAGGYFVIASPNGNYHTGLIRFNEDGSRDTGFHAELPEKWTVTEIVVQSDGKIVVASQDDYPSYLFHISRLNADGSIDNTFNSNIPQYYSIHDLDIQVDGKLLVAGENSYLGGTANLNKGLLRRLNTDGSNDDLFNPNIQLREYAASVKNVTIYENGDMLISGTFDSCNGIDRYGFAKLNVAGELKEEFKVGFDQITGIYDQYVLNDGKIRVSGSFGLIKDGKHLRSTLIQLNSDGTFDQIFEQFSGTYGVAGSYMNVGKLYPLSTNELFYIGSIGFQNDYNSTAGPLIKLKSDITVDPSFSIGAGVERWASVYALGVQNDGKIIIGGDFNFVDNISRNHIARLNFDGSLDTSFNPDIGLTGNVYSILLLNDGKILVAGDFQYYNHRQIINLVRLNQDGSLDSDFVVDENNVECYFAMALQDDGKIVLKGRVNTLGRLKLLRINSNGNIDPTFAPQEMSGGEYISDFDLNSRLPIAIQNDGKIITQNRRYDTNGNIDPLFQPAKGLFVTIESDSTIIMRGGEFGYTSEYLDGLHRVNYQGAILKVFDNEIQDDEISSIFFLPNKKMIINRQSEYNATSPQTRRLNYDGSIDYNFDGRNMLAVDRIEMKSQSSDYILVAGGMNYPVDPKTTYFNALVRLKTSAPTTQIINFPAIDDQIYAKKTLKLKLMPTSTSNLDVTLEVLSGPASISGDTLLITNTGKISVRASQQGDIEFLMASPVTRTFYAKEKQVIDFKTIDTQIFNTESITLNASASSSLPVELVLLEGQATIIDTKLVATNAGHVTIRATQNGNDHFFPAESITQSFCLNPPTPIIEFKGDKLESSSANNNQWFIDGSPINDQTQNSINYTTTGTYSVQVTVNGCSSAFSLGFLITAVEGTKKFNFSAYPNPASTTIYFELQDNQTDVCIINLYYVSGEKVLTKKINRINNLLRGEIGIESLPRGVYILEVVSKSDILINRFVMH